MTSLRTHRTTAVLVQASEVVDKCCLLDERVGAFRLPSETELHGRRVIICTCIAAAFLLRYPSNGSLDLRCRVPVSHVLIDEAGQAPLLEALLPMLLADECSGAIGLAGDPHQLGPVIRSQVAAAAGLGESMLERLINYYHALPRAAPARVMCTLLVRNYRSHVQLLRLPSDLFYGSALVAAADQATTQPPAWSLLDTARALSSPHLRVARELS